MPFSLPVSCTRKESSVRTLKAGVKARGVPKITKNLRPLGNLCRKKPLGLPDNSEYPGAPGSSSSLSTVGKGFVSLTHWTGIGEILRAGMIGPCLEMIALRSRSDCM